MLGYDVNIIERGIRGIFAREFMTRQKAAKYPLIATVIDSDKQEEKFNMISTLPQLSEYTDERHLAGFSEYSYTLKNRVYGTAMRIPRTMFEFDQTGQLRTLVQSLGARVANFPDKLIFALLGSNGNCYDGKPFFGATHDLGNGTAQTNDMAGGLSNALITAAVSGSAKTDRDNMIAAAQMDLINAEGLLADLKDDRNEPWHDSAEPEGLAIICHQRAKFALRTATEAAIIQDTGNLTLKSVSQIISTNRPEPFTDGGGTVRYGTWYLVKLDTPIKPLLFQRFGPKQNFPDAIPEADQAVLQALNTIEIQSVMRTGQNISEFTFFNDDFLFGARTIYTGGYGMWQNAIRVKGSDFA